jgi:acyl-CoA thioesterase
MQARDRPSTASTHFQRQMELDDADDAGRYQTVIGSEWNCPLVPHGGIVTAVAASAMRDELDHPEQQLRSVTAVFAGQVRPGPVEVDVTVLRRGRTMSQAAATIHNVDEATGHTSVAVFGAPRPGFEFTDLAPPSAPPPESCPTFRDRPDGADESIHFNFWDHVEGRAAAGHAPWEDYVPTTSELLSWYRFDEPPRLGDGTIEPLALVTLCDTMPGAVRERMGPGLPAWLPPSADLTVHLLGDARSDWLLGRNRARRASDGYASVELELWDPDVGLVAYGTQTMFFTFPDGPPGRDQQAPRTPGHDAT